MNNQRNKTLLIIVAILLALFALFLKFGTLPAILASVVVLAGVGYYFWRQRQKAGAGSDELDTALDTALANIDSIGQAYANENEANTELAQSLRLLLPKADIEYLANSAVGDIRVGEDIVEGKLDLVGMSDIDRAVGQIGRHLKASSGQLKIVVYGRISEEAGRRIMAVDGYGERIRLHYLQKPRKFRTTLSALKI
jgi:hypothetical protein